MKNLTKLLFVILLLAGTTLCFAIPASSFQTDTSRMARLTALAEKSDYVFIGEMVRDSYTLHMPPDSSMGIKSGSLKVQQVLKGGLPSGNVTELFEPMGKEHKKRAYKKAPSIAEQDLV